jgi:hypothetical protein
MLIRRALLQMRQNPRNGLRLLDAGDHLERPAAAGAGVDLDAKDALEALRPAHPDVARDDQWVSCLIRTLPFAAHSPMRRRHRCAKLAVRGEHPMKPVRCIRGGGISAAKRAIRSSGSSTMCVVPSR